MKNFKNRTILVVFVVFSVVLLFVFSGCTQKIASKVIEKAIESAAAKEGESVDVNIEEGEVNITDKEGNELSIGGAEVPEDWPSAVPINNDIKILFSGKQTTDGKANWTISGTFNGDSKNLYEYYKGSFSGWDEDLDSSSSAEGGQKTYYYQVSDDSYVVSLIIGEKTDEGVSVILTVSEK